MTSKTKSTNNEGINEWSKIYGRPITEDEYTEICQNLSGFFDILRQWKQKELNITETELPLSPTEK